jgi:LAO/AO transport system kinase
MVDVFLLLALARTGDQLQGIKKGVLELADVIAVNKADGAHAGEARRAARELSGALRLLHADTPVLTCSGLEGSGLAELWGEITARHDAMAARGELAERRRAQQVAWTRELVRDRLLARLREDPALREVVAGAEAEVLGGALTPSAAADRILAAYGPAADRVPGTV